MKQMKRSSVLFALGVFALVYLTGCSIDLVRPEEPVLLLNIQDWDGNTGATYVSAVSIHKTAPTAATVTIASRLDLYAESEGGMHAGYTFRLEEGASYNTVTYTHGVTPVPVTVHINAAEAGMTYVVGLFF